jgi:hypothetical protein
MRRHESTDDVKGWFAGAIAKLWPVAEGSISLRHCPCIRKNCPVCARGRGHASYVLYARKGRRRTSIYVRHELASKLEALSRMVGDCSSSSMKPEYDTPRH